MLNIHIFILCLFLFIFFLILIIILRNIASFFKKVGYWFVNDFVTDKNLGSMSSQSFRNCLVPDIRLICMYVNISRILGYRNKCIIIAIWWVLEALKDDFFKSIFSVKEIHSIFDIFLHGCNITMGIFIKNKINNFLFSNFGMWNIICMLDQNQSNNFFPVLIQNFFANLVGSDTVGAKSLHAEVVDETKLLHIFNIFLYICIWYISIDESECHRKSITF